MLGTKELLAKARRSNKLEWDWKFYEYLTKWVIEKLLGEKHENI